MLRRLSRNLLFAAALLFALVLPGCKGDPEPPEERKPPTLPVDPETNKPIS